MTKNKNEEENRSLPHFLFTLTSEDTLCVKHAIYLLHLLHGYSQTLLLLQPNTMSYLPPAKNVLKATARLRRVKPQTPHHMLLDVLKNLRRVLLKRNLHISTNRRDAQMGLAGSSMLRAFAKADFGITFCAKEYIEEEINNKELFVLNVVEPIPPLF